MTIETCAKVNLTLEVLSRRADGFHELATVFQAIDLCDRLTFTPAESLTVSVVGADVPCDGRNLCWRAAALLAERAGVVPDVHIAVRKSIPVGAGLGGGSGNAAGTLAALAQMWQLGLDAGELEVLAAELGSDCAFFVKGGAAVGRGRGEALVSLPPAEDLNLLLVGPREPVPTGSVYGALREFRAEAGQATEVLAAGLRAGHLPPRAEWLVNDLEAPALTVAACLAEDRDVLAALVPGRHRLSGSGGSWFVVLNDPAAAAALAARLMAEWPGRLVRPVQAVAWGWREVAWGHDPVDGG